MTLLDIKQKFWGPSHKILCQVCLWSWAPIRHTFLTQIFFDVFHFLKLLQTYESIKIFWIAADIFHTTQWYQKILQVTLAINCNALHWKNWMSLKYTLKLIQVSIAQKLSNILKNQCKHCKHVIEILHLHSGLGSRVEVHPQKFWFVENRWKSETKSPKTLAEMTPNVLWLQKIASNICRKTNEERFFGSHTKKGFHDLCGKKFVGRSRTTTLQAGLEN